MEVECWSEDWGIPSVDPESLKVLAFAKFSGAPVVQKSTNNPFWSPTGNLPVFRHNGVVLTEFSSVVKHLKSCNYSADYNLTSKQESVKLIESIYSQYSEFGEIGNDTIVETSVYKAAQECMTLLSNRLADNHFMFGRSASSLDAVMYGYLAPLLKAPLPNNSLQNYLNNCGNLVKFVVRISQNYFPKVVKSYDEQQLNKNKQSQQQHSGGDSNATDDADEVWPNQTRNKVIAGAVAATAMMGYAYTSGLVDVVRNIEIRFSDQEYEDEEEEEEDEMVEPEEDEGGE